MKGSKFKVQPGLLTLERPGVACRTLRRDLRTQGRDWPALATFLDISCSPSLILFFFAYHYLTFFYTYSVSLFHQMHHPLDSNIQRTGIFVCFCPLVYPQRQELVLGTEEEAILICFKKILSDLREENFSKFKDRSDSKRLYTITGQFRKWTKCVHLSFQILAKKQSCCNRGFRKEGSGEHFPRQETCSVLRRELKVIQRTQC